MSFRRQAACFVLALLGSTILVAPAMSSPQGKRVALFMGPTQDKYLGAISKGFETAANAAGMKVTVFSSPFDPALQAQQIDDAIAQKYDMLVVQPISQKALAPPLTRAKDAKIPVALVVVPLEDPAMQNLYVTYAGYDDTELGKLAGEALASELAASGHKSANIAIIAGSMDEGKAPLRQKAFVAALAKNPGMTVVATEDVKWNPATAERSSGQLLARFAGKGGLDAIYGMNDTLANAVIQAATAAGVPLGTKQTGLVVVGGNCQAIGIKNVESGKMAATVLDLPTEEGKLAAEKVAEHFNGKPLDKKYFLPPQIITQKNSAAFAKDCSY